MSFGGSGLLTRFGSSLRQALEHAYPEHEWLEWKFSRAGSNFWNDVQNQRAFMDWVGRQLGITSFDGWYNVPIQDICDRGGSTLLARTYNGSIYTALSTIYPEHEWLEWNFHGVPRGFWKKQENTKRYFEWLGKKLGVQSLDDWYSFTIDDWEKHGAAGFMSHVYDNSRKKALQIAFPDHDWDAKRFKVFAYDTQSQDELKTILERQIAPQVQVTNLDDWYRVSWGQFKTSGFSKLLSRYGGMYELLSSLYPEHPWDQARFRLQKGKPSQRILKLTIEKLFPGQEIFEEFLLPSMSSPSSQRLPMQFDIGVPGLHLVFEFQGLQHYKDAYRYGQQSEASVSDLDKAAACSRANYTLIPVPHWWDQKSDSLANTIRQSRPDLFPHPVGDGAPIPPHASP